MSIVVWMVFYAAGWVVILAGIRFFLKNRFDKYMPAKLLGFLFGVMFCWYLPIEISRDSFTLPEGILAAVLQGIGAVKQGTYRKDFQNMEVPIATLFSTSILAVRVVMLLDTYMAVVALFSRPLADIQNLLLKNRKTYIFSELNDKTVSIAKDICSKGKKARIVFTTEQKLLRTSPYRESVNRVGGILYEERSVIDYLASEIRDRGFGRTKPELFLFGESESENIKCLSELRKLCEQKNMPDIRVFVEMKTASWDSASNIAATLKGITVNFIWTEENFAFNNLLEHSILQNAEPVGNDREIRVLFVGMDAYSYEMLKCILWLGQMPAHRLRISVIDSANYLDRLAMQCPGIRNKMDEKGFAIYEIRNFTDMKYDSKRFTECLEQCADFTFAFVNTGRMEQNAQIADTLRVAHLRRESQSGCIIQVRNDSHDMLLENWSFVSGTAEQKNAAVDVQEVGLFETIYSYDNVTNSRIERIAREIHDLRHGVGQDGSSGWPAYCKDEYKRKAAYARALGITAKLQVINRFYAGDVSVLFHDTEWVIYEHMRWDMYTWILGYVHGKEKDKEKRTHDCLVPFEELTKEKQDNDRIELNDAIVKVIERLT